MIETNDIRKNYERLDNHQIIKLAKNDSKGLRNEVVPILIEEIRKRNLGVELIEWINAERRQLTKYEFEELKRKVKQSQCTNCKRKQNLKGYEFRTQVGVLIDNFVSDYKLILCEKCGNKKRINSGLITAIFGWWSVAGFVSTPFVLINKIKASKKSYEQSEEIIESFIQSNIGIITLEKESQQVIQELLKEFNDIFE